MAYLWKCPQCDNVLAFGDDEDAYHDADACEVWQSVRDDEVEREWAAVS